MASLYPSHIDRRHPIVQKEYAVYTPPIDEMVEIIGDWMDRRVPGGYIYGASRFGKSRGVKFHVRAELEKRFRPKVPLVIWIRPPGVQTSEAGFWHEILEATNFEFLKAGRPAPATEGRKLVRERFITLARQARNNYVVLVIDEAQLVTYNEWQWLTGLQNKLDFAGYRLSVFSIGTQQMAYQHNLLGNSGNAHVAARFMVESARFHGISDIEQLEYVLNGYDCDSEWPSGSGRSFLQYFSQDNFERGRRLKDTAQDMWKALCALSLNAEEFPMQHIAYSVETALGRLANSEEWADVTSYNGWLSTINATSLGKHMDLVSKRV
jgi:hypothetical protein